MGLLRWACERKLLPDLGRAMVAAGGGGGDGCGNWCCCCCGGAPCSMGSALGWRGPIRAAPSAKRSARDGERRNMTRGIRAAGGKGRGEAEGEGGRRRTADGFLWLPRRSAAFCSSSACHSSRRRCVSGAISSTTLVYSFTTFPPLSDGDSRRLGDCPRRTARCNGGEASEIGEEWV